MLNIVAVQNESIDTELLLFSVCHRRVLPLS